MESKHLNLLMTKWPDVDAGIRISPIANFNFPIVYFGELAIWDAMDYDFIIKQEFYAKK